MTKYAKNKQLKQLENQSQSGRSMVEMLGVLAIIGVLSIGGIVGYKLAMNYYQASQIAHEMNMMRTDAQIKIAQGTEKLTLGSPYDEHKINFNDYGTVFDCALADEEKVTLDVSCSVANAYYIELQEIPEGVCQPLARLINGMDNLIDFYINAPDAEGENKDICNADFNTLTAIFGADSDSEAVKCDDDPECEFLKSTPVCDKPRHVCVECVIHDDCTQGDGGICIENKCNYCADGEVRDESSKCVECTENSDCLKKGTDNPICNENKCVECETNAQCTAKGKDPHCHKATHTCEPCPDGSRSEGNACVLSIDTISFFYSLSSRVQVITCQKLTPHHFGPYTHSYELWVKGTFDDYIQFYVNEELPNISTTELTYEGCNDTEFEQRVNCADHGGAGDCSTYLSDYHLGSLNAGDFGNLIIQNVNSWIAWGGIGKEGKLTNDAAAWLVLKEEEE